MYAVGEGVPENDIEAVKWWRLAAEQGHAKAQFFLGLAYGTGEGVLENDVECVKWYHLAARQGHAEAQIFLGAMYAKGMRGLPQDDTQAYVWFSIAAAQGNTFGREMKERVAQSMARAEVAAAQELAREYWESYVLPFRD